MEGFLIVLAERKHDCYHRPDENEDCDRFMRKVQKTEEGCWLWAAGASAGYGMVAFRGKVWRAHRVAFELYIGAIPAHRLVCHHCDNPLCVNPDHLYVGTPSDNVRDCIQRGRRTTVKKEAPFESQLRRPGHRCNGGCDRPATRSIPMALYVGDPTEKGKFYFCEECYELARD